MARFLAVLSRPVDIAWLAAFRVLYGVALCFSMLRFILYGWVDPLFVSPRFQFKYFGFSWVELPASIDLQSVFWALVGLALAMALGLLYRFTSFAFALGLAYVQLLDASNYLNHYYLAALMALLLSVSPAAQAYSVDAWLRRKFQRKKERDAPRYTSIRVAWLYLFRLQVGTVYFFAGMAKAHSDWLVHGQPLRIWLGANVDLPVIGPLFTLTHVPLLFSWFGFLFDTTVVGFLLWRRTRLWAYGAVVLFHIATRLLFPIGMFPVIMVGAALVFFEPSWPRTLLSRFGLTHKALNERTAALPSIAPWRMRLGVCLGLFYAALQVGLPLRHLAYGGNVLWHEQGMRLSWRVMLRAKGGSTTFIVRNPVTTRIFHVSPRVYLTPFQEGEMSGQPDLILQLAQRIKRDFTHSESVPVEVRVESFVSLNGRRASRFIDPEVDLSLMQDSFGRATWILPAPTEAPPHTRPVL